MLHTRAVPHDRNETLRRYPRICAHVICESLGYATPTVAAGILLAAIKGEKHYCEWVYSCYRCDATLPVKSAIARRHQHRGYMAEYSQALALVNRAIRTGDEPMLASWF